ncbi:YrzI family small protein [Peribacillus sp. SCS-37]
MTISMLFFTISIKPVKKTRREAFHEEQIKKWHDENVDKMLQIHTIM